MTFSFWVGTEHASTDNTALTLRWMNIHYSSMEEALKVGATENVTQSVASIYKAREELEKRGEKVSFDTATRRYVITEELAKKQAPKSHALRVAKEIWELTNYSYMTGADPLLHFNEKDVVGIDVHVNGKEIDVLDDFEDNLQATYGSEPDSAFTFLLGLQSADARDEDGAEWADVSLVQLEHILLYYMLTTHNK